MKKILFSLLLSAAFVAGVFVLSSDNAYAGETVKTLNYKIVTSDDTSNVKKGNKITFSIVLNSSASNIKSGSIEIYGVESFDLEGKWNSALTKDISTFDADNNKGAFAFKTCKSVESGTIFTFTATATKALDSFNIEVKLDFKTYNGSKEYTIANGDKTLFVISNSSLTGLKKLANGKWYYLISGKIQTSFTGFVTNTNGTWYVKSGNFNFETNGLLKGTFNGTTKWGNVYGGKLQKRVAIAKNSNGWWYIGADGFVDFSYNGICSNSSGTFKFTKGMITFKENGIIKVDGKCYLFKNSKLVCGPCLQKNSSGMWYVNEKGYVDFSYRGIYKNSYGSWYICGGKVRFDYTGKVTIKGITYNIVGGKVR